MAEAVDFQEYAATVTNSTQLEVFLNDILAECNRMAKIKTDTITREVAMAKMINYCIRMLHSEGWIPRTIVRAMVHLETSDTATVRNMMWKALRERREERRLVLEARKDNEMSLGGSKNRRDGHEVVEGAVHTNKAVNGVHEQPHSATKDDSVSTHA